MAISRFLIGGVASALLLTGGLFLWAGYTQIAEDEVLPEPPPALAAIPVAGANAPKRGPAPPACPPRRRRRARNGVSTASTATVTTGSAASS